jgi:hypothetical protein
MPLFGFLQVLTQLAATGLHACWVLQQQLCMGVAWNS